MTAPDTRAWLDGLDQARAAATPGDWELLPYEGGIWASHPSGPFGTTVTFAEEIHPDDAALIVAAVNALEPLTRAVRAVLDLADRVTDHIVTAAANTWREDIAA